MHLNHAAITRSPALRVSLKRGLARQAIAMADRNAPDLASLFRLAASLRPNTKAVERLAVRLRGRPGVSRVTMSRDGKSLTYTARAVRDLDAQVGGETVFQETGIIYLRVTVAFTGHCLGFHVSAISFCRHALERLVERSDLGLDAALLPQIDIEAQAIHIGWDRAVLIEEAGDEYFPAVTPGLWAGSFDEMVLDQASSLATGLGWFPVFSVRTFLSEAEMRPTVWLRWKDDPLCRMIA